MKRLAILTALALSACGVDGPPERPAPDKPGISITGDAQIGVTTRL